MVKGKKIIYSKLFEGEPKPDNFQLEEFDVPALKDGEVLCVAEYLSVDPYMRPYMKQFPIGTTMIGGQVARIIESKNDLFPVNGYVFGTFGWKTHTVFKPAENTDPWKQSKITEPYLLPDYNQMNVPFSLVLGYLGMPGNTSYFGFLDICQPKSGETVVITAGAGAVGSLVGQIAKLKGCKVIGIAGSDEKCNWLTTELGFDHAINYKTTTDISKSLKAVAPNGIDCYFDNVGGEISSIIINQMNTFGRISVCGAITSYNNDTELPKATILQSAFIWKQLKMEGFLVNRWIDRYNEAKQDILKWIGEGKVKYRETVTNGFENMPQAFIEMLKGKNIGKAIVKV